MKIHTIVVNPLCVDCYIIHDEQTHEAAVIDPGMFTARECNDMQTYILDNQLQVRHILLTHAHFDHAMSCRWAAEHLADSSLPVSLHSDDVPLLQCMSEQTRIFLHRELPCAVPASITTLYDSATVSIGNTTLHVIHTPGHTPGGVCYHEPSSGTLFSGDTLFQGSIGRTDLDGGDYATLVGSLNKLSHLPDATVVLPGHGPSTTIGDEHRYNPYF